MSDEQREVPADMPPSMHVMELLWPAAMTVQAIHVAARLGVADFLHGEPKDVEELARATNSDAPSLERLLRALTSLGIFAEDGTGRYRQTPASDALRSDSAESMRRWALMLGAGFVWQPSGALDTTVRTGRPAFEHVYGTGFFEHLSRHPDDAAVFDGAMSSLPSFLTAIVDAYDFSTFERIVDVGGGRGALLIEILKAHPRLRGVLHDLPGVVDDVRGDAAGVGDRLEIVPGDFFHDIPTGADGYIMSGVIHDWNDHAALEILKACRRAMSSNSRLLILDSVLTPSGHPAQAMMDLLMMVLTGGRERTESEFRSLLSRAGFTLDRVIPTAGRSILEARPV